MALRFKILGSSSSGNCSLLISDDARILIDAGFSGKRIAEMLEEAGESVDRIDAVFVTHEHSDHITGLRGLTRGRDLPIFANRATAQAVQRPINRRLEWKIFETGATVRFRDLEVDTFSIPHDAYDPVGFVFKHGNGDLFSPRRSLAWVTDLGYAPESVKRKIAEVDLLVLESNHCSDLLRMSGRPFSLKQRISGRHGHLSNSAASELVGGIENPAWQHLLLAHLSSECNSIEAVKRSFAFVEEQSLDYRLSIVQSGAGTSFIDL